MLVLLAAAPAGAEITFLNAWGTNGAGDGQFDSPSGVAVSSTGQVITPLGVAVSNTGQVYVADSGNNRIQRFSADGTYELQWGGSGSGDGQFSHPWGIAVSPSGQVYVADALDDRVQRFFDSDAWISGTNEFVNSAYGPTEVGIGPGGSTFDRETLPDLGALLAMDVFYDTNTVTLAVVPALTGDYNFDGTVNAADYTVWRDALGQAGAGLAADGDRSGTIDAVDYGIWKTNFGMTAPAALEAAQEAAIPERSAALLMLLFAVGVCLRGPRRCVASRVDL